MATQLCLICLAIVSFNSFAARVLRFQHFSEDQGLNSRSIWNIQQDKQGIIWLATTSGLVSFDGYDFQAYRNPTRQASLSSNVTRSIYVMDDANLLVGTYHGLALVDRYKKELRTIENPLFSEREIYSINGFKSNELWVGTDKGVLYVDNLLDSNSRTLKIDAIPEVRINDIKRISENEFLFATRKGIYHFNFKTNQSFKVELKTEYRANKIQKSTTRGWLVATDQGLFNYNNSSRKLTFIDLAGKHIISLASTSERVYAGTRNDGLYIFHTDGRRENIKTSKSYSYSIPDNDVYSLLLDNNGILWLGTFNNGLATHNPKNEMFQLYNNSEKSWSCLSNPVIYSMFEDINQNLWLGTQFGLAYVSNKSGQCKLFTTKSEEIRLPSNQVNMIFESRKNPTILKVSTSRGLIKVNINTKKQVTADYKYPSLSIYGRILEPEKGEYIATNAGVYFREISSEIFTQLKSNDQALSNSMMFDIVKTNNDDILLASWDGLLTIGEDNLISRVNWNNKALFENTIRALYIDSSSNIWIGIDNLGLFEVNSDGKVLSSFEDPKVLHAINGFAAIIEDQNNKLWLSSIEGISAITPDKEIMNFRSSDGLPSKHFVRGSRLITKNGQIFFGNRKGATIFNPSEIKRDNRPPNIFITDLIDLKNSMSSEGSTSASSRFQEEFHKTKTLSLEYFQNSLGFEFSALHYADPKRNGYAYKMLNWDNEWTTTESKRRRVEYRNLPPGKYALLLKASNHHDVWTQTPVRIEINISSPWWETIWAYICYILLTLLSIIASIKYRTKALTKRAHDLEVSVEKRTEELASEKEKVELLLSRKNEEFANVSHEFRTPLTLILGPIAQLLKLKHSAEEIQKLNVVQRNGYRLLRMVDQLLNLETFRIKSITQRSPQPIGKIVKMLAETFEQLAPEKEVQFKVGKIADINFEFTPDAIEKILLNVLSNAFKYTSKGDSIYISASRIKDSYYHIIVSDTGIGIPEDKLTSVFERFGRVLNEDSEKITGAGIGLSLVKSLIESHGGEICLESLYGEGTKVTIKLPIINEVSNLNKNLSSNSEIIAMELMSLQKQESSVNSIKSELVEDSNKPIVLVIEDNVDMRNYISQSISDDYLVLVAEDGKQGFESAKIHVPDLIISDVMMPKLDGYQTTNRLRHDEVTSHIPILLLTARGDRKSRLKGWYEKADEYVTKPFDVEELKIRIHNLLEIRNILKKRFSENVFKPENGFQSNSTLLKTFDESEIEENKAKLQTAFVCKLNDFLENNFSNPDFSIEEFADSVAMSKRQLFRKLRSILDMTPSEYVRRFRLEKSKQLLASGKTAQFAAMEVGFSSLSYFSRCFKAQYNISPSEFSKTSSARLN